MYVIQVRMLEVASVSRSHVIGALPLKAVQKCKVGPATISRQKASTVT